MLKGGGKALGLVGKAEDVAKTGAGLSKNAKALLNNEDVTVGSFKEADELLAEAFPDAQKVAGAGQKSGERAKNLQDAFKQNPNNPVDMYHKDYLYDPSTGAIYGHDPGSTHGDLPHINIKTEGGSKVTIYIQKG